MLLSLSENSSCVIIKITNQALQNAPSSLRYCIEENQENSLFFGNCDEGMAVLDFSTSITLPCEEECFEVRSSFPQPIERV